MKAKDMKEIIITEPPDLDPDTMHIADMHSMVNLLSILIGVLTVLELEVEHFNDELTRLIDELREITSEMQIKANLQSALNRIRMSEDPVIGLVNRIVEKSSFKFEADDELLANYLSNLRSIYKIAVERLDELALREENPDLRIEISVEDFRRKFEEVFYAIEKNAKGKYRIHYNLALKEKGDYYFDLKIESTMEHNKLHVPLRLLDVLRDLTANARKYTKPGGKVALAVMQDEKRIRCCIEDTGCGIPKDELEKVVEFGYRASNVRHRPTMGGGFGLTKAVWLVLRWNGKFTIASEEGRGTSIHIDIPNPA